MTHDGTQGEIGRLDLARRVRCEGEDIQSQYLTIRTSTPKFNEQHKTKQALKTHQIKHAERAEKQRAARVRIAQL